MLTDKQKYISNLNVNEDNDHLSNIKTKIQSIESKISVQQDEINKTLAIIEQFKNCYQEQSEALKKFEDDKIKCLKEYNFLIESNLNFGKVSETDINIVKTKNVGIPEPSTGNLDRSSSEISPKQNEQNTIRQQITRNLVKKLKRKGTPPNISKTGLRKKKKPPKDPLTNSNNKNLTKEHKKCKALEKSDQIISVLLKVDTWPLNKITLVNDDCVIQRINSQNSEEIFMCGSRGLLASYSTAMINYYPGHFRKLVKDFYVCSNEKLLSVGPDYIIINTLNDYKRGQTVSTFPSDIMCTCIYKNKVYGTLRNGTIFVVETKSEEVRVYPNVLNDPVISIIIVKLDHIKLLVTANTKNEIASYSLGDLNWLNLVKVVKLDDTVKGLTNYSSNIICYTTHFIFLLDKPLEKIIMLREITNEIMFLEANMNTIIVLDDYNILHKYLIKKSKVKPGSTVENLPLEGTATAMSYNYQKKMVIQ